MMRVSRLGKGVFICDSFVVTFEADIYCVRYTSTAASAAAK
jgi:hypothetical protein